MSVYYLKCAKFAGANTLVNLFACRQLLRMVLYVTRNHVMTENLSSSSDLFEKIPLQLKVGCLIIMEGSKLTEKS